MLGRFTEAVMADGDRSLFWEDDASSSDAGNRCKLHVRHALPAKLTSLRTGATQHRLAATFDVQSTMSWCLWYCIMILCRMLPTAEEMADVICKTPADRIEEMIPKTILIDGTMTPADRPGDKTARKTRYTGRKKRRMYNTPVTTNLDGLAPDCSETVDGSVNDKGLMNAGGGPDLKTHESNEERRKRRRSGKRRL